MVSGKSSLASSAENQVTLHETAAEEVWQPRTIPNKAGTRNTRRANHSMANDQRKNPTAMSHRLVVRSGRRRRCCKRHHHAGAMEEGGFSKCLNPTAWVRAFHCNSVYITRYRSMTIPVSIRTHYFMANKKALVDSGDTDNFMHPNFAKRMGLGMKTLPKPKKIFNIDNTTNKSGMITHYLDLNIVTKGIHKEMCFLITDIGQEEVLLGYPWLATFEPKFNWRSATMEPRFMPVIISSINPWIIRSQPIIASTLMHNEKQSIVRQLETKCTIQGISTDLAIQAGKQTKDAEIPKEYQEFAQLFSDKAADRFPPAREWDHAIELKPGAPDALDCKIYPMTRDEDTALKKFLDEIVAKGYIRPSKSPYASPFFFVKKKDGKLQPVQDY
jgi:hypothetical protein